MPVISWKQGVDLASSQFPSLSHGTSLESVESFLPLTASGFEAECEMFICLWCIAPTPAGEARHWEWAGPDWGGGAVCAKAATRLSWAFNRPEFYLDRLPGPVWTLLQPHVFQVLYITDGIPPRAGGSAYSFFWNKYKIHLLFTMLCYRDGTAVSCCFVLAHSSEFWPSMKLMEGELRRETMYWTWCLKVQTSNVVSTYPAENSHGICLSCILNSSLTLSCLTAAWCSLNVI